ncbi:hypothetical protein NQ314_010706 [Rhamnusium bicolor]|uniref:Uncharacterized protein n=1 Tax=Rhamnusium bicolor TaxID=1586634 RepID=A0AAV8XPT3_9CUCU|nr:hypothetical protein NQ314_010706 [Rhamnusium bicolor]
MKTENMHLSTNSRDKENVSSQDDSIINVKIVCVLTPLTCATLVNEIFKSLLYQKTQIPYPYSWLRAVVHKKRSKSDNEETNKQINFTVANHFRVVSNAYDTLEKIMKAIIKEFSENANYIKEIIFSLWDNAAMPKRNFYH